jgi:cell wall-associated NlpC family hydrolase
MRRSFAAFFILLSSCTFLSPSLKRSPQSFSEKDWRRDIIEESKDHLTKPFIWDTNGPDSFDCSGFVHYVLKKVLGPNLFPVPYDLALIKKQSKKSYKSQAVYFSELIQKKGGAIDCSDAKEGDIVFFSAKEAKRPNHIGIIVDPRRKTFIAAQGKKIGVQIHTYKEDSYWDKAGKKGPECLRNIWVQD